MSSPVDFTAENFLPPTVLTYLGHLNVTASVKAVIKSEPSDFQVEEMQRDLLCTVSQKSDLIEPLDITQVDSNLWEITVAKIQMTTFAVRQELARLLGVEAKDVTYGGLKDRWGRTAQRFTVRCSKKQLLQALSMRRPQELPNGRAGWFIKDPTPAKAHMRKGQLEGNRFTLRVLLPGMTAKQIEAYLHPMIEHLSEHGNLIPNAYGRQRLGRRQNLLAVGKKLIEEGPAAAIEMFLTDTSPNESPLATQVRLEIKELWDEAAEQARLKGEPIEMQHFEFESMRSRLEPLRRRLNMTIEYEILERTLSIGYRDGFRGVMASMRDEFSLWVGAYQGFFFNQVLRRVIDGELVLSGRSVPLFIDEPTAKRFYQRNCPEALPARIDSDVRDLFLSARKDGRGPWRPLFIPVRDFEGRYENGVWHTRFFLRSGAYATTFLGILLDLEGDEKVVADEKVCA